MKKVSKKKRLTALLTEKRWEKIKTYAQNQELTLTSIIERFIDEGIPDMKKKDGSEE